MRTYYELEYKHLLPISLTRLSVNMIGLEEAVEKCLRGMIETFNPDWLFHGGLNVEWVNRDTHMIEMSLQFPFLVFTLEGNDEDVRFRIYYHNGKLQYTAGIMTFEEFDEAELK